MQYFTGALIPVHLPVQCRYRTGKSLHALRRAHRRCRPLVRLAPAPRDATLGPATVPL